MACELKRLKLVLCVLLPVLLGAGASFPALDMAVQLNSRGTKEAFSKVFPAFLMIPESKDSFT